MYNYKICNFVLFCCIYFCVYPDISLHLQKNFVMHAITLLNCTFTPSECAALNVINYLDIEVKPNTELFLNRAQFTEIIAKLNAYVNNGFFIDYRLECKNLAYSMNLYLERYS